MVFEVVISYMYLFVTCITFLSAVTALTVTVIYRKRCFNFPTLLACNTILGILIFSANGIAMTAYMIIWDRQTTPNVDYLCSIRAYFYHTSVAFIHHTFILQAVEKYLKIRQIHLFDRPIRKLLLVLSQWTFDFFFILPILLTGNLVKPKIDNFCFISLSRLDLLIGIALGSFFVTDVTVITLYRLLVKYVRNTTAVITGNQKVRMERDLTMVRRILMLNGLLVLVGSPALVFNILNAVRGDLIPNYTLRVIMFVMNIPMTFLVVVLCLQTPRLHESVAECFNVIVGIVGMARNRIRPTAESTYA